MRRPSVQIPFEFFTKNISLQFVCFLNEFVQKKISQNSNKIFILFYSPFLRFELSQSMCYLGVSFIWSDYHKSFNKVVMLIKDWNGKNKSDSSVSYAFRHFKKTGMLANQNSWMPYNFMPRMAQVCFSAETSRCRTNSRISQYNKFSWHQIFFTQFVL